MTQQIKDIAVYKDSSYYPYPVERGNELFDLADHGMRASSPSTACWKGYQAKYEIIYDTLYLTHLGVYLLDENGRALRGPVLHYVEPRFGDASAAERAMPDWFNNYYELRYPLPFSGQLLLGDEGSYFMNHSRDCGDAFVREYEDTIGPSWCYRHKTLYRLSFEGGKLIQEEDLSDLNKRYRDLVEAEHSRQHKKWLEENPIPDEGDGAPF